jgi:predicted RNA-binding Zn-ribbon protein involved in translation (DUF1610 family)
MASTKNDKINANPGCLGGLLRLIRISQKPIQPKQIDKATPIEATPYLMRDDFLSEAEKSFYQVIKGMMGNYLTICPKVSLSDIVYVSRHHENLQAYHNKIDRKHIDFLLCDATTMKPRFAIELDDSSHQRADRIERDEFVDRVFKAAGLPLLHVPVRGSYDTRELGALLKAALESHAQSQPVSIVDVPSKNSAPLCPQCGAPMVIREARKGTNRGSKFYGCPNYPKCKAIVPISD